MTRSALDRARDRAAERRRRRAARAPARAASSSGADTTCSSSPARSPTARSRWSTSPTSSASRVLKLPALQRPLSLRADAAAILGSCASSSGERRPDVLHTHTAKAGATGGWRPCSRAARGRGRSSTPTTVTSSAATSAGAGSASSGAIERVLARSTGTLDRRQRRGARRSRRLRRRPGGSVRRRPVRLRPARVGRGRRRGARAHARRARPRRRHVRDRLGGPADRDQAAARPRSHPARRRWTRASTPCSCSSATARTGRSVGGARARPRRRRALPLRRLPAAYPRVVRGCRRLAARRRRTRGRRSWRSSRSPPGGRSSRRARAARRPSSPTARAATCSPVGDIDGAGAPARRARARPRAARAARAGTAPPTCAPASPPARMADELEAVYRAQLLA